MSRNGTNHGQGEAKIPKIKVLRVRMDVNLEVAFFCALISYFKRIAEKLGFSTGRLAYEFVSTSLAAEKGARQLTEPPANPVLNGEQVKQIEELQPIAHFNVGGQDVRGWDSHGRPDSGQVCSVEVVLEDHDFLASRPWLQPLVERVMLSDKEGRQVSADPRNLRELISSLGDYKFGQPEVVLEWGKLGFFGVFENAREGIGVDQLFNSRALTAGVKLFLRRLQEQGKLNAIQVSQQFEWFDGLLRKAAYNSKVKYRQALKEIRAAEERGEVGEVGIPELGKIRVVMVTNSWNYKIPAASRRLGYHVVIHRQPSGQVQIHSSTIKVGENEEDKVKLHLGPVAERLRRLEAHFRNERLARMQNLSRVGVVYTEQGTWIPWYLAPYRSGLLNGSRSARDVEPTLIHPTKLLKEILTALPRCQKIPAYSSEFSAAAEVA